MLKLIQLEIHKNKLTGILKAFAIVILCILGIMLLIIYDDRSANGGEFNTFPKIFGILYALVKAAFIIFASVLLGRLVINEYKNNTITVLFMYPIPRKKLMMAKILIVFLFTLISIILSDVVIIAALAGMNSFVHFIPEQLEMSMLLSQLTRIGTDAVCAAGIALIPLYFGMRNKSVSATIVASVLVTCFVSAGTGDFQIGNLLGVSIVLGLLGACIVYLAIRNIETEDIA
ncbi:ABC transporter permease [Paenibacillus sp. HW567]|uniref:ABC transporter permease n=1 Tax=Paenibacillus sp. HW567 TaxID=1034769 RepID=UPI00036D26DE|nr:ABC transporter permease [Paenibacillus sp. HW567]